MIIINLNSQLGNQMFQYALARKLQTLGRKVKFDTRYYKQYPDHYTLNIFPVTVDVASGNEIGKQRDERRTYPARLRRKLFGRRKSIFSEVESRSLMYKPEIFQLKHGYVDGYWQSEKYFCDIHSIILKDFRFPPVNDSKNRELLDRISQQTTVSIHIRRGDYANGFPMMTPQYYENAISYFENKYKKVFFLVFSNDMEWARQNVKFSQGEFIDWNTGKESWKDMHLMTQCNHHIIANSSFSWWGAWLNQKENKEVIAPSVWFHHQETPDVYCEGWKIINI